MLEQHERSRLSSFLCTFCRPWGRFFYLSCPAVGGHTYINKKIARPCRRRLAEFAACGEKNQIRFPKRHVRAGKHFSARKCASTASAQQRAAKECHERRLPFVAGEKRSPALAGRRSDIAGEMAYFWAKYSSMQARTRFICSVVPMDTRRHFSSRALCFRGRTKILWSDR